MSIEKMHRLFVTRKHPNNLTISDPTVDDLRLLALLDLRRTDSLAKHGVDSKFVYLDHRKVSINRRL